MNYKALLTACLCFLTFFVFSQPKFPLKVSDNGRYFIDSNGNPFFYQADTGWQLFARLTLSEAREYLKLRRDQGFTAIQVMISINPDSVNRAGEKPFIDYDFSRPNEKYFNHTAKVIEIADSLGLLLTIAPAWIGCCREGYGVEAKHEMYKDNGVEKSKKYGLYLGKMFGHFNNIFWLAGGDNDPLSIRKEIEGVATGLKQVAPHQLITFHAGPPHSSTDLFQYAPWLGFSMIYTYWREKPNEWLNPEKMVEVYEAALREYVKSDRMPFVLGESQYEGTGIAYPNDMGTPHIVRRQAYWTMLSGGAGHAYGHDGWSFPKEWRTIMKYPGAEQMRYVKNFFQSINWWKLIPDYNHEILIANYGNYSSSAYVTGAYSEDKTTFVAYLPKPGYITLDLSKLKGPTLTGRWYNPQNGEYKKIDPVKNQGVKKFFSPFFDDWVLIIESTNK